jgi:hypothetical protein
MRARGGERNTAVWSGICRSSDRYAASRHLDGFHQGEVIMLFARFEQRRETGNVLLQIIA